MPNSAPERLPDQTGRVVIVTGASSGIGLVTARELARAGARVVLAVRDVAKGEAVASAIEGQTEVRRLDLADLASVRTFAADWTSDIDVLVNNAGIMQVPEGKTRDSFELQFGVNHLGHFALTELLLPQISSRVVTVTSALSAQGRLDLADANWEKRPYRSLQAYRDAKQANILFTSELQRRLSQDGSTVLALSAHPGVASTNLADHIGGVQGWFGRRLAQSVDAGARPTLFAVTADVPPNGYLGPQGIGGLRGAPGIARAPKSTRDPELARRLWELSAQLTGTRDGTSTIHRTPNTDHDKQNTP